MIIKSFMLGVSVMDKVELKAVQDRYQRQYDVGIIEFSSVFLGTKYGTYNRWFSADVPIPGSVCVAARMLDYLAAAGKSESEIRAIIGRVS